MLSMQQIPIVLSIDGTTTDRMMRWGLVPSSGTSSYPLINATVEKFKTGWPWKLFWKKAQRCIFTMAGFHEPHVFPGGRRETFVVCTSGIRRSSAWRASEGEAGGGRGGGAVLRADHDTGE